MGHLAMTRELQMMLLPSSEMLLTSPILNMDCHFKFAALTPFGLSINTQHAQLLGYVVTLRDWKCSLQPKVCLDSIHCITWITTGHESCWNHDHLSTWIKIRGCLALLLGRESQSMDWASTWTKCTQEICKSPVFCSSNQHQKLPNWLYAMYTFSADSS